MEDKEKKELEQPEEIASASEETTSITEENKPTNKQALREMLNSLIEGYSPDDEERSSELLMKYLNDNNAQKAKLSEALKNDPRIAQLLSDIVSGKKNAAGALARYFGKDFLSAEEGSPEYEAIIQAEEERKAEQETTEASSKEYQNNLEKSMPEVETYCKEKGCSVDEFLDNAWNRLIQPVLSGLYSREICEFIDKGINYDKDVNDASEAGYVKGRNENIHKMKEEKGDGMPKLTGSESVKEKPKKSGNSFIEMAMNA